jgi:hypothetical protein
MSTRQKPLPTWLVSCDGRRCWLGLPRIVAAPGSPGQLFALGLDLAADQARQLVLDGTEIEGPVPVGDEPAGLLRSAELLLRRVAPMVVSDAFDDLRATVADLVWETNTGVGG